jgi:hypothetical protein
MTAQQAKTREYLADDDLWPSWPHFCMRNRDLGELGFVSADNPLRVYVGNFYEFAVTKKYPDKVREYKNVEELLDAGWLGD